MEEVRDIDAKQVLDELIERVARGEEIVITRAGRPIARLVQPNPAAEDDRAAARAAVARIRERRPNMRLAPDTIADLKHVGHKY